MRLVLTVAFCLLSLRSGFGVEDPGTVAPAPTPPAATADLSIADALEGIADEDQPTREKALKRLEHATAADIPALEKFADSTDLEIHRQVNLILQQLNRGEVSFLVAFADGKPLAGIKLNVRLFAGEPQSYPSGKRMVFIMQTPVDGPDGKPNGSVGLPARELYSAELTTDAAGKIVVGRYNDGTYTWCVEVSDPLPAQQSVGKIKLTHGAEPGVIKFRRGTTVTVTVLDEDNKPLSDATVADFESNINFPTMRNLHPSRVHFYFRRGITATCDDQGIAVLEKVGLSEINLTAVKDGYFPAFKEKVEFEDGKNLAVTFQLTSIKPIDVKLTCQSHDRKLLVGFHVLAVRQADVGEILGAAWNSTLDRKIIDTYVKAGAIDMGTTDDKGLVTHVLLPENYLLLGFHDDSDAVVLATAKISRDSSEMKMIFEDLPRPKP